MKSLPNAITVEVRCIDVPATCAGELIYLGIQKGREVEPIVPAATGKAFPPEFRLVDVDGVPNFLGPFVQGSRQERFFYLSWGKGDTCSTFAMFRPLKVHISHGATFERQKSVRVR